MKHEEKYYCWIVFFFFSQICSTAKADSNGADKEGIMCLEFLVLRIFYPDFFILIIFYGMFDIVADFMYKSWLSGLTRNS